MVVSSSLCGLSPCPCPWSGDLGVLSFGGVNCCGVLGGSALPGGAAQPCMALKRCCGGVGEAVLGEGTAEVRTRFTGDASSAWASRVLFLVPIKPSFPAVPIRWELSSTPAVARTSFMGGGASKRAPAAAAATPALPPPSFFLPSAAEQSGPASGACMH